MYKLFTFIVVLILLIGCKKPDEQYGRLTIYGTVKDHLSNSVIPNTPVYLFEQKYNAYGGNLFKYRVLDSTLADINGTYVLHFEANGQLGFELEAVPSDPYYVSSVYAINNLEITKPKIYKRNINCARSAFAQFNFINNPPLDTIRHILISTLRKLLTPNEEIYIPSISTDNTVYLKLIGYPIWTNEIKYRSTKFDHELTLQANPWDTIPILVEY